MTSNNYQENIEKLHTLLKDLLFMQNHLYEIIDRLEAHAECEERIMMLYTIEFNDAIHDINIFFKEILDLCIELYWNEPSYICTPTYKRLKFE